MVLKKGEVIDIVWQFSSYYVNQLICLENIKENNSIAALIYLANILENVLKNYKNDYDCKFFEAINYAHTQKILTDVEFEFLNNSKSGIRKLRNIFAHANLSKFSFQLHNSSLLYPFTENENCELFYDLISDIIFNIICKIAIQYLIIDQEIILDTAIKELNYSIITFTPEQILEEKGIDCKTLFGWDKPDESEKYRQAENAQNVKILSYLFSQIDSQIKNN